MDQVLHSAQNSTFYASGSKPTYLPDFSFYLKNDLKLRNFQAEMIQTNLDCPSRIIYNASQMGLGKTVEGLVHANVRLYPYLAKGITPFLLIVGPASLGLLWIDEAKKWLLPGIEFAFVSYTKLVRNESLYRQLLNHPFHGLIFDEFHKCRTMTAQTTFQSFGLWNIPTLDFIYPMSGTPMEYSAIDLFPVLAATVARLPYVSAQTKHLCSDYDYFGRTFCYPFDSYRGNDLAIRYKNVRNEDYLMHILYDELKFFFRDLLDDKLPELPKHQITMVPIELSTKATRDIPALEEFELYHTLYQARAEDTHTATVRRLLGMAKATNTMFLEYVDNILEQREPVVIMSYHSDVTAFLAEYFKAYNPVRYTGEETRAEQYKAVQDFQAGRSDVFLGNIDAAGEGTTLTRSNQIIMLEWHWLPTKVDQAIRRLVRLTQERKVTAHFISAVNNKFDQHMLHSMVAIQKGIDKVMQ